VLGAGGIQLAPSSSNATFNLDITLGANQTWSTIGGGWTVSQPVHLNGSTLTVRSFPIVTRSDGG
jgi:hypothetical protein